MKRTINIHQFRDAFQSQRPNQFSYSALSVLFDYLEDLERDLGYEIELDVIALCCDWSEYTSAVNACTAWGWNLFDENEALEKLRDNTQVIQFDGGVLVQDF